MKFSKVHIEGIALEEASLKVKSTDLEKKLAPLFQKYQMRPHLISALTGIEERRFWEGSPHVHELAARVGIKAIESSGIERSKVSLVINSSVSKDFLEPSVASMVCGLLGLPQKTINYDIGNACLGFLNAMEIAATAIEKEEIEYALVVNAENSQIVIDNTIQYLLSKEIDEQTLRENFATLTLGCGASAIVLCHEKNATKPHKFKGGVSLSATEHYDLCRGTYERMRTDASKLLKAGIKLATETFREAETELGWKSDNLDLIITHQVGKSHTEKFIDSLDFPREKFFNIYKNFGNIGPASIPYALQMANQTNCLKEGMRVALMGIGSGINCSMMEIQW